MEARFKGVCPPDLTSYRLVFKSGNNRWYLVLVAIQKDKRKGTEFGVDGVVTGSGHSQAFRVTATCCFSQACWLYGDGSALRGSFHLHTSMCTLHSHVKTSFNESGSRNVGYARISS